MSTKSKESKVDTGQLEEMMQYMESAIKQLKAKIDTQIDDRRNITNYGKEVHTNWTNVNKDISQMNDGNATTEKQNNQEEIAPLAILENFPETVEIMDSLSTNFENVQDQLQELDENKEKLKNLCQFVLEKIQTMETLLNDDKDLRKKVLDNVIIKDGNLAISAGDALAGNTVGSVMGYEGAWDAETHFIFKDGAILVKSGDDYNGWITTSALGTIAKSVADAKNIKYPDKIALDGAEETDDKKKEEKEEFGTDGAEKTYGAGKNESPTSDINFEYNDGCITDNNDGTYTYKKITGIGMTPQTVNTETFSSSQVNDAVKNFLSENNVYVATNSDATYSSLMSPSEADLENYSKLEYGNVQTIEDKGNCIVLHTNIEKDQQRISYRINIDHKSDNISLSKTLTNPIGYDN